MAEGSASAEPSESVLWDVVEEHLDEAAFGIDAFDRMLEHPFLSLADLATYPEERLLAHLDGLVVGGDTVADRLLIPALQEADPAEPARVTAAALALLLTGKHRALKPALEHEDPAVRRAAVRACSLASTPKLEAFVRDELQASPPPHATAGLLHALAALGATPPALLTWLQHADPAVVEAAACAARRADARMHLPIVEHLLGHADLAVQRAAMLTALVWGSPHAWATCERLALDREQPNAAVMALCAALGSPAHHTRMLELLGQDTHRAQALFALGFSGNVAAMPALLDHVAGKDPLHAKLALQAIALITDLDLRDDAFALPEPPTPEPGSATPAEEEAADESALPALEQDDLDADLVAPPEDALPLPNAPAIRAYWGASAARYDVARRYLRGQPLQHVGIELVLDHLERGPLRTHHVLALSLAVRTRGEVWLDTRAFSAQQRSTRAAARSSGARLSPSPFSRF